MVERDVGGGQRGKIRRRHGGIQLVEPVDVAGEVGPQARQVHAVAAQRVELPGRPPRLPAAEGRGEVRHVVPEPLDALSELLDLVVRIRLAAHERDAGQDAVRIMDGPMRPAAGVRHGADIGDGQLAVRAVGEDEEHGVVAVEVLDLQRFAQRADDHPAICPHGIALAIGRHRAQVDVGVGIGRPGGVGSGQVAGDDPMVGPAGIGEAVEQVVQLLLPHAHRSSTSGRTR